METDIGCRPSGFPVTPAKPALVGVAGKQLFPRRGSRSARNKSPHARHDDSLTNVLTKSVAFEYKVTRKLFRRRMKGLGIAFWRRRPGRQRARHYSLAAASPFRAVNRFVTAFTPSTGLAALAAREICQVCGTVPESVTTPWLTRM